MKFEGFPERMHFTPVPDLFINRFVAGIATGELQLMLTVFNLIYNKKGYPRYVTEEEIGAHPAMKGLKDVRALLLSATRNGFLLALQTNDRKETNAVFFLNNPEGRKAASGAGSHELPGKDHNPQLETDETASLPDIFTLYEENIGLITPMVAEQIKDALLTYRDNWIRDALKEAVSLNKRSWRYIERILERWRTEGRNETSPSGFTGNEKHQPDIERDKFVSGRYGPLIQR